MSWRRVRRESCPGDPLSATLHQGAARSGSGSGSAGHRFRSISGGEKRDPSLFFLASLRRKDATHVHGRHAAASAVQFSCSDDTARPCSAALRCTGGQGSRAPRAVAPCSPALPARLPICFFRSDEVLRASTFGHAH